MEKGQARRQPKREAANREVVAAVIRAELNLVGLAMRAGRKLIDKIVDGLKFTVGWFKASQVACASTCDRPF